MTEPTNISSDIFPPTRWTRVIAAQKEDSQADDALNDLCQAYWQPVYGFIRRKVADMGEAEDLTQDYFASLIRRGYLKSARQDIGRLRAFLLSDIKLFLNNARRNRGAEKRGGQAVIVSLDVELAERQHLNSLPASMTDENVFDRVWALQTLEEGRKRLAAEYTSSGRGAVHAALSPWIDKSPTLADYEKLCVEAGLASADAAKVALSRMRSRLGNALREVVLDTVTDPREAEDELRQLFAVLVQS